MPSLAGPGIILIDTRTGRHKPPAFKKAFPNTTHTPAGRQSVLMSAHHKAELRCTCRCRSASRRRHVLLPAEAPPHCAAARPHQAAERPPPDTATPRVALGIFPTALRGLVVCSCVCLYVLSHTSSVHRRRLDVLPNSLHSRVNIPLTDL